MDNETAVEDFKTILREQPDVTPAIGAVTVLQEFLKQDTSQTVQGLYENMKSVINAFLKMEGVVPSIKSASEIYLRNISFTTLDQSDFKECKKVLVERGEDFIKEMSKARSKIADITLKHVRDKCRHKDNTKILIHSHSRVVYDSLVLTHRANVHFHVYVTESAPDYSGKKMYERLKEAGIDCTLILDAAIGFFMEQIDFVLLGADAVAESGGIINKMGTYGLAFAAHSMNKEVCVLAESFKFIQMYPVNQRDLFNEMKLLGLDPGLPELSVIDYTPPNFINFIFSDIGIRTTEYIVEETMIKLYV